jgi:DNA-binding MarR family transcriptional regulator
MGRAIALDTPYRNDRLRQLRAFCFTAEAGSISRAAERLGLTQPSVSLQIQALERRQHLTRCRAAGADTALGVVADTGTGARIRNRPF